MAKQNRETIEELIERIATGHPQDIFYSDVSLYLKNAKLVSSESFQQVCRELRARDIWVHS
jgi:hypothetical protein